MVFIATTKDLDGANRELRNASCRPTSDHLPGFRDSPWVATPALLPGSKLHIYHKMVKYVVISRQI